MGGLWKCPLHRPKPDLAPWERDNNFRSWLPQILCIKLFFSFPALTLHPPIDVACTIQDVSVSISFLHVCACRVQLLQSLLPSWTRHTYVKLALLYSVSDNLELQGKLVANSTSKTPYQQTKLSTEQPLPTITIHEFLDIHSTSCLLSRTPSRATSSLPLVLAEMARPILLRSTMARRNHTW